MTYAPTEFEVTTSKALGGEAFTRNSILDLDLEVKVTQTIAQYPLHHVNHPATKFEVARSNRLGGDTFTRIIQYLTFDLDLGVKVTQKVAKDPLHHVTFSATKFEVATSKG